MDDMTKKWARQEVRRYFERKIKNTAEETALDRALWFDLCLTDRDVAFLRDLKIGVE